MVSATLFHQTKYRKLVHIHLFFVNVSHTSQTKYRNLGQRSMHFFTKNTQRRNLFDDFYEKNQGQQNCTTVRLGTINREGLLIVKVH